MELLLNLAWFLLALPAYWLWRGRNSARKFSSLQCLLALGCLLVILFPVISATDDLRVMRTEMEESPASKRSFRQASSDKAPSWNTGFQNPAAVSSVNNSIVNDESWQQRSRPTLLVPTPPAITRVSRGPPNSFLG
ncbi:MAG TPA: hypothetical protein VFE61_33430 [Candidatus Sulfotelmatobacter sp.]|jgi:hypothetical protein|nr:hypothetical protein [Candidatus Sulfotelmatobacter sp.]